MARFDMSPGLARHLLSLLDQGVDIGASSDDILDLEYAAELDRQDNPDYDPAMQVDPFTEELCIDCGCPSTCRCDLCDIPLCDDHAHGGTNGSFCFDCANK